jgi:hypothetical protein
MNDQTEQQQQEMKRIRDLANSIANPQDMLAAVLRRLDLVYLYRDDRLTTDDLLKPDLKEKATLLHRVVGASDFPDLLKHTICGAVEFFLRNTCAVGVEEMKEFKSGCAYDPATHNIFAGLEGE